MKERIAKFHNQKGGKPEIEASQVFVGSGTKPLLFSLQMVLDCDLLLPSPSWSSYSPQASLLNKKTHWIQTNFKENWKLTPKLLGSFLENHKTQFSENGKYVPPLLIINSPSNPIGNVYEEAELRELSKVLRENRVLVVSDEIYSDLYFGGKQGDECEGECASIQKEYGEGTIISNGISKFVGGGGYRVGYLILPKQLSLLAKVLSNVYSETHSVVSAPIQFATISCYENYDIIKETYLKHCRRVLKVISKKMYSIFTEAGISTLKCEGGFYFFLDFSNFEEKLRGRGVEDSFQLCNSLLEEALVATLPGANFGRPRQQLCLRLSFVDFDGRNVLHLLRSNPNASEQQILHLTQRCTIGAEKIVNWLKKN